MEHNVQISYVVVAETEQEAIDLLVKYQTDIQFQLRNRLYDNPVIRLVDVTIDGRKE